MFLFLQCIKGEAGASGISGADGRQGHPVSRKQTLLIIRLVFCRLFELLLSLLGLLEIEDLLHIMHGRNMKYAVILS